MWIVYVSIAIVLFSLAFLGFTAFKAVKAAKPAINQLNETMARVQRKADTLKVESNQLTESQQELKADIDYKKQAVTFTVNSAKSTFASFKKLWKIKPMARISRRKKSRTPAY